MPKEYQFYGYDKLSIIKNIRELGGKNQGQYIFRVAVFNHPLKIQNTYIRVRDEGFRKTLTYKIKKTNSELEEEHETIIENFEESVNILLGLGCTKKYSYEKIREIWHLSNTEIVFDTNPGEPEIMELESSSRKYLDNIVKKLDLSQFKMIEYKYIINIESIESELQKVTAELYYLHNSISSYLSIQHPCICTICLESKIEYFIDPCGHTLCNNCKNKMNESCYYCRSKINTIRKLYLLDS